MLGSNRNGVVGNTRSKVFVPVSVSVMGPLKTVWKFDPLSAAKLVLVPLTVAVVLDRPIVTL